MIHQPPEAFLKAAELHRAQLEGREAFSPDRALMYLAVGVLTLAVHVGLYLALTRREGPPPMPLQLPAAVMIDLSPEAVVAKSELDNAADGPPAPTTAPSEPEPVEEAPPPPAPEPIVEAPPPPPNVKPQAALPSKPPKTQERKVEKTEKPVERKPAVKPPPKPVEKLEKKDKPSPASRSGGGPKSDQHTADRTAAAAAGSAISQASQASWQNEVRARILRAKRYPTNAFGAVGVTLVSVAFAPNGSVAGARLVVSSGNAALDAEALAVIYRAAPYAPPPGGKPITQSVPINFNRR